MAIQMTRAEYQQKYGTPAQQQSSQPIRMTRAEYEQKYGSQTQQPQEEGFLSRIGSKLAQRGRNIEEEFLGGFEKGTAEGASLKDKLLSAPRAALRTLGQAAGGIGDIGAEALPAAAKLYNVMSLGGADRAKEQLADLAKTEAGQKGIEYAKKGAKYLEEIKAENPELSKDIGAVMNIAEAIPLIKGLSTATKAGAVATKEASKTALEGAIKSPIKAVSKAADIADTLVEKGTRKLLAGTEGDLTKLSRRAIKPTKGLKNTPLGKVDEAIKETNDFMVERGFKPQSMVEYRDQLKQAKNDFWKNEIESKIKDKAKVMTDMTPLADELDKLASSKTLITAGKSNPIKQISNNIRKIGNYNLEELEDLKQFFNKEINWGAAKQDTALNQAYRKATDFIGVREDKLLAELPGEFSKLKKKYGKLAEAYNHIENRANVIERQSPVGLLEGVSRIEGLGKIAKGMLSAPMAPGQGLSEVGAGLGQFAMGRSLKYMNDPDFMIKTVFDQLAKKKGKLPLKPK